MYLPAFATSSFTSLSKDIKETRYIFHRRHLSHSLKIDINVSFWLSNFEFWHLPSGKIVWPQASDFQRIAKLTIFRHFNQRLSTLNVNVARSKCWMNFFCDFHTPCPLSIYKPFLWYLLVVTNDRWSFAIALHHSSWNISKWFNVSQDKEELFLLI